MNDHDFLQQLDLSELDPFSFHLQREAALQFYERSLTTADPHVFKQFVQEQVLHNPLYVELLYEIGGDLQQRLNALQEYYDETRNRVLNAIQERYQVDLRAIIRPLLPYYYHSIPPAHLLDNLRQKGVAFSEQDQPVVLEMFKHSTTICGQLASDMELTQSLLGLLHDWMMAGCVNTMRQRPFWMTGTDGALKVQ
jgi:hypothetical protein